MISTAPNRVPRFRAKGAGIGAVEGDRKRAWVMAASKQSKRCVCGTSAVDQRVIASDA
jgi:hypothetical protein